MRLKPAAVLLAALCVACAGERRSAPPPAASERYRVVKRGAATLYCRPEILTGTRFPKTVCLTASELKAERIHAREMLHSLDEGQANFCNGKPCTGE